jgi:hypothetical protein
MELLEIPSWMEKTLLQLTNGQYNSIQELKNDVESVKNTSLHGMISTINNIINTLEALNFIGVLKVSTQKPIESVQTGEIINIENRFYIKNSSEVKDSNVYSLREIIGGKNLTYSHIGEEIFMSFDGDVTVVPNFQTSYEI